MKERWNLPPEARPPSGAGRAGTWSPPELKPENERLLADLAYALGWLLKGDGCSFKCEYKDGYIAELKNKDYSAIQAVNLAMARLLKRRPVKIRRGFVASWECKGFVSWFQRQTLDTLRRYIEFSEETMKEFIQGYCDGSVGDYVIYICGVEGHRDVLEYVRQLCQRLGIRVGDVKPYGEGPGRTVTIRDRVAVREQRRLRFSINAKDFLKVVGFNHSGEGQGVQKHDQRSQVDAVARGSARKSAEVTRRGFWATNT